MTNAATIKCPGVWNRGCGALLEVNNFGGVCYSCGRAYFDSELLDEWVKQHGWMEAEDPALD